MGYLKPKKARRQKLVDDFFDNQATYWRDTYREKDLNGIIYQRRQALALNYIDELHLQENSRVLEIGCGAGFMTVSLAKRGFFVEAIDHSQAMINLTITHAKAEGVENRINACIGDIHELNYENQSFNLIVALGVIPWLYDFQKALSEIARVMLPGGFVVVTIDNGIRLTRLLDPLTFPAFARIQRFRRQKIEKTANILPYSQHTPKNFKSYLNLVGLTLMKSGSIGFGPFTFLGYRLFSEKTGLKINQKLQDYADKGFPVLQLTGSQHIFLATKKA